MKFSDAAVTDLIVTAQSNFPHRERFEARLAQIIKNKGEVPVYEPKTAAGHVKGWARRTGTVLGTVGGAAVLIIGDIAAWQNLGWIDGIGATVLAVGVAAGTIWYVVDEYNA